jgi:hypothetical protein
MQLSIFSSEEPPARASRSQDFAKDLLTSAAISHLSLFGWLRGFAPAGWFGKMSPASCHRTEDGRLAPSSEGWRNSGMGSPTGFSTLNISECHKDAGVCSLSDILETGDLPQRYFLSAKACSGILRRAGKRGKDLPPPLAHALKAVADSVPTSTSMVASLQAEPDFACESCGETNSKTWFPTCEWCGHEQAEYVETDNP